MSILSLGQIRVVKIKKDYPDAHESFSILFLYLELYFIDRVQAASQLFVSDREMLIKLNKYELSYPKTSGLHISNV